MIQFLVFHVVNKMFFLPQITWTKHFFFSFFFVLALFYDHFDETPVHVFHEQVKCNSNIYYKIGTLWEITK